MTYSTAQQDALSTAHKLLGEHFDCALIVTQYEDNDHEDRPIDSCIVQFTGGFFTAMGLARTAVRFFDTKNPCNKLEDP